MRLRRYIIFTLFGVQPLYAACVHDIPTGRYETSESVVIDHKSGLSWTRCLAGQEVKNDSCEGLAKKLTWNDADDFANSQEEAWRIPVLQEIETILNLSCSEQIWPANFAFPDTEIWTASPGFPVNDVAAIINTADGSTWGTGKGVTRHFFLVKGEIKADY